MCKINVHIADTWVAAAPWPVWLWPDHFLAKSKARRVRFNVHACIPKACTKAALELQLLYLTCELAKWLRGELSNIAESDSWPDHLQITGATHVMMHTKG